MNKLLYKLYFLTYFFILLYQLHIEYILYILSFSALRKIYVVQNEGGGRFLHQLWVLTSHPRPTSSN